MNLYFIQKDLNLKIHIFYMMSQKYKISNMTKDVKDSWLDIMKPEFKKTIFFRNFRAHKKTSRKISHRLYFPLSL